MDWRLSDEEINTLVGKIWDENTSRYLPLKEWMEKRDRAIADAASDKAKNAIMRRLEEEVEACGNDSEQVRQNIRDWLASQEGRWTGD